MGRIEANLSDDAERMDLFNEDVISVARQILPMAEGFAAAVEALDTGTGEMRLRLLRLGADGRPRDGTGAAGSRSLDGTGAHASLALAAARIEAVRRAEGAVAAALGDAGPEEIIEIAADSRVLVALAGERDSFRGQDQRLRRLLLPPRGSLEPEELDLGPLALTQTRSITGLALLAGWLYVLVADATGGFEVFRAPAEGEAPRLGPVLREGAQRFALNAAVSALGRAPDGLLLGTAALAPGAAKVGNWGPELIWLRHDGSWDLLIGQPRFTPDGLKRPVSGRMPGLDDPRNAAIKAIATRPAGGGTMTYILLQDFEGDPVEDRRQAVPDLLDYMGDVRVFGSADLREWQEVPLSWPRGLGAVTALAATEAGFLVGHERAGDRVPPVTFIPYP